MAAASFAGYGVQVVSALATGSHGSPSRSAAAGERRSRHLALSIVVTVTVLATYGSMRVPEPPELSLVVLASVTLTSSGAATTAFGNVEALAREVCGVCS